MILTKEDNDQFANVYIPIKSDAYINGIPDFVSQNKNYISQLSTVHRIIYMSHYTPNLDDVYYSKIEMGYINELVALHREWFPMNYDKDYFKKFFLKPNYYCLGAFIEINGIAYLIGCALGETCSENRFRSNVQGVLRRKKWYQYFSKDDQCGYLNAIGVIDEFRKLKVGSELLRRFVDEMKKRNCIALFLHVIDHNLSAIKFYEKNSWSHGGVIPRYYFINHAYFEAQVLYTIIQSKEEFKTVEILKTGDMEGVIRTRGCCKSLWIKVLRILAD